jgi:Xaa-Pro aminopeptidase
MTRETSLEHGTARGVRLDVERGPMIGERGAAILIGGVVVTVDPGVYLPGVGDISTEDTLVDTPIATEDGSRSLTALMKDVAA